MRITELVHPFVLEVRQQLAPAQLERLFEPVVLQVLTERGGVDPHPGTVEADALTCREHGLARSVPSDRRIAQIAFCRLARALESSTSGQKRAARSARWWLPGLSASQANSERARHDPLSSIGPLEVSTASSPSRRIRSMWQAYRRDRLSHSELSRML